MPTKPHPLVIGLDYGSDSARALLVDTVTGAELASAVAPYPRWRKGLYCDPAAQVFRQHPLDHLAVLRTTVREALRQAGRGAAERVVGLGIDTTGSSPLPVDARGQALALDPAFAEDPDAMMVLWKDHSSAPMAARFNDLAHSGDFAHDYTRFVGGIYSSEWYWAKAAQVLGRNRRVAAATAAWVEHCDWLPALLCGIADPQAIPRSRCAAGHKACWHASWDGLPDATFLKALHPRLPALAASFASTTVTCDHPVGTLSPAWAKTLGLSSSVVVASGAFDAHLGALGAGAKPFVLTKVMGTSTCDMLTCPAKALDGRSVRGICGQVDGSIVPGLIGLEAGQSAFGDVFAWFARLLSWPLAQASSAAERKAAERLQAGLLPALDRAAAILPPGAGGHLALDWFNGRRSPDADAGARAAISGLHLASDAPAVYRSLVEATAFGARAIVERFVAEGVPVKGVLALGGIARKSPLVMQISADVLARPISVVASDQCCALGAAIAAAVAAGVQPSVSAAQRVMASKIERRYRPQAKAVRAYETLYRAYLQLGQATQNP